jgi:hypothetical protein
VGREHEVFEKKKRKEAAVAHLQPPYLPLYLSIYNKIHSQHVKAGRNEKGRTSLDFIKKCKEVFNKNLNFEL